jgi:hypothetical protein
VIDKFVDLTRYPAAVTLDEYGWLYPDYYLERNTSYTNARDHGGDVHVCKSGEILYTLLQCYELAAQFGDIHPEWVAYVERALNTFVTNQFANGTFGNTWTAGLSGSCNDVAGCGGVTVALSLMELYAITGNTSYADAATLAMNYYITEFVDNALYFGWDTGRYDFNYGYKKHILDSKTAEYTLKALVRCYELTGDSLYLTKAQLTAEWLLSWQYAWNVPFADTSRLGAQHFRTKGILATSVELNALRLAYGSAYILEEVATYLANEELHTRAELVLSASKQMIATATVPLGMNGSLVGSQESYWYHTAFTEDNNAPQGGSSNLCYGINIAEAYVGTNVSIEPNSSGGNSEINDDDGGGNNDGGGGGDSTTGSAQGLNISVNVDNGTIFQKNDNNVIYVNVTDDRGIPVKQAHVTVSIGNYTFTCEENEPGLYKAVLDTSELAAGEYILTITVEKSGYLTAAHHYKVTVKEGLNLAFISFTARLIALGGIMTFFTILGKRTLIDDITLEL